MNFKYILINLFSNDNPTNKVRLGKPPVKRNIKMEFNVFIKRNFNFITLAVMIAVILFFIWFCFFHNWNKCS